jgi:dipeptidyl aminopeptidase/acylaminoacyl peptidase
MKKYTITLTLLLVISFSAFAQTKRGFEPSDIYSLREISDAQISPDGSRVVYVVTEVSPDRTRNVSRLWIVSTSGGEPKRLTTDEADESVPRWSPDSQWIAFYSNRDGKNGLWLISPEGSQPQLVTHPLRTNFFLTHSGESFTWAPDSRRIAFLSSPESKASEPRTTAAGPPGIPERLMRPLTPEEINQLPKEVREMILRAQGKPVDGSNAKAAATSAPATASAPAAVSVQATTFPKPAQAVNDDPRVVTRLQYKSRTAFSDNLQSHIFIANLATRQTRQLTEGRFYQHSINWSPKGDEIVFVSNHEPDPDKVNNTDLFTVNVGTGAIRQLTKTKGCEWSPVFSPDGNQIAYLATKREITTIDSVAEDAHAYVIASAGGEAKDVTQGLDRRASSVKWNATGKAILFTAGNQGKTLIYRADSGKTPEALINSQGQFAGFSVSLNGKIACVFSQTAAPGEVHLLTETTENSATNVQQKITSGASALSAISMNSSLDFKFDDEGLNIHGWVVPPLNYDAQKKYPVILYIHGGPHGMWGYGFDPTVQALAARGYATLMINPRGSSGYGQKFSDGCVNDWGGGDYRDLMKGVDEALVKFPWLDGNRLGVIGGSYGGYMTNWIVTQTDRFKAAIARASLSNLISFYATSLYQDLIHAEFGGYPWDNYELLWERSPLKHVKKVRTPLMLTHGENDNDVHITQAEEMFTAVKMRGVETVLVRYPREGHGVREPRHREYALRTALDWFDKYLKK